MTETRRRSSRSRIRGMAPSPSLGGVAPATARAVAGLRVPQSNANRTATAAEPGSARGARARSAPTRAGAGTRAAAVLLAWGGVFLRGSGGVGVARADDSLNVAVEDAFVFAGTQLTVLTEGVLTEEGAFTDYTDTDGKWMTEKSNGDTIDQTVWTSGMVAGMFWYQYEATGDAAMKTAAEFYLSGLEGVETTDDNDLGFQVLNSFGLGARLTDSTSDKAAWEARVLTGADTLYEEKWDANIPAFWSWANPNDRPEWDRAVNVDMIMNMEIMLWSGANGGGNYDDNVVSHGDTTWLDIVRDDNSTNHVAAYDIDTGEFLETGTYQGWQDNSTWSRGQAWGVYGYAMLYRYLAEPRFLDRSLGLFGYWEDNLPDDYVPYADYDAPAPSDENGKDSSSTAIVASALLELFLLTEDPAYLVKAQEHLSGVLTADYYLPDATDGYQSILRRATSEWGDEEVGATFGDYFLLETMVRYKKLAPSILLWEETAVEVVAARRRQLLEEGDVQERDAAEEEGGRRLQTLNGGKFCQLAFSGGTVSFADPACVPEAPDFSSIDGSSATPSPTTGGDQIIVDQSTPSPSADPRGGIDGTLAPSLTPAPTATGTEMLATLQPSVSTGAPIGTAPVVSVSPASGTPAPSEGLAVSTQQPLVAITPTASPVVEAVTTAPVFDTEAPVAVPATQQPESVVVAPSFAPVAVVVPPTDAPIGSVVTPAPVVAVTEAPSVAVISTVPPTAGGTTAAESTDVTFGLMTLGHDVDLSYLSATSNMVVWLSVTLDNASNTPATLTLVNADGDTYSTDITAPAAGWQAGSNRVKFDAPLGTFVPASWTTVVSVVVGMATSLTATVGASTTITVDWLVISNELVL